MNADDEPTFWEKLLVFVIVVAGTGASIWIGMNVVQAGFGLLGACR